MMEDVWMTNPRLPDALKADWAAMNRGKNERGALKRFNQDKLGMFIHWGPLFHSLRGMG